MSVSIGARPARAKATPVSRERFPMPAGHGGAWPAPSQRTEPHISDQAPLVWRAPEGPEGTGGLRDRPLRAAGSRVAISRAAGPDGARNNSGATSIKLNREFRLHRRCEGRKRARPQRPWAAAEPGRAPSQRTESTHRATHQRPGATVWRAPEGPEGTGGLRGAAPNEVRAPSLAGGRALRRPEHQRGNSTAGNQAISGSRAPSGSPTRKQHPPGQASAPNRRRRARDPRPRR